MITPVTDKIGEAMIMGVEKGVIFPRQLCVRMA